MMEKQQNPVGVINTLIPRVLVTDAPIFKTIKISSAHDGTGSIMIEIIIKKTNASIKSDAEKRSRTFLTLNTTILSLGGLSIKLLGPSD